MQRLTPQGQAVVGDLARRHGFSADAVTHMLLAVLNGNGGMAQFSHPEFGGSGQWMRGGLLMLSDMFNHALKGRVGALCHEIADILASQRGLQDTGSFQSEGQGGGKYPPHSPEEPRGISGLLVSEPIDQWWPSELGMPNATGAQNDVRYAYFAQPRRLAVRVGGSTSVYDTGDHCIGGVSQQQGIGGPGSVSFTSQHGVIDLASLPVVSHDYSPSQSQGVAVATSSSGPTESDVFSAIERLGALKEKGLLTEEEFAAKKTELLGRL
ncbi:SHOCT domain-containing protein [Modicisalibacter luteus]|uniref:SHOCT domain-containing protein n=2 Tax=Modicisalibacter luteus TaxID=453962 RepID=A0ABV7LZU4_9GAMM|nr:SHOCT domain-containing protein [Halomonas lutea]GHA94129.1 hypothetical protein GCM10007159_14800 [Halomonas lutea]